MPTFGSLFAGIGGIDLGLERAGWTCAWQVEWDAYCQRVLAKHWPDVPRYGDITTVDWSGVERVDLLAGGFPCQPVSLAGKGRAQADERWLWPEFARAIRDLRPRLVLVENVPGLLARGMGDVLGDLASLGYDAEWRIVSAASVGAPHLRERVWIVAHDDRGDRRASGPGQARTGSAGHPVDGCPSDPAGRAASVADAACDGRESRRAGDAAQEPRGWEPHRSDIGADGLAHADGIGREGEWSRWLPDFGLTPRRDDADRRRSPLADADGQPSGWAPEPRRERGQWATEPDVGRVAHGVPARVDRLRALGNAVVPQVVEVIGRQLLATIESAA